MSEWAVPSRGHDLALQARDMPLLSRPHLEASPLLQCGKTVGSQPVPRTRILGGDPELEVSPPLTSPDKALRLPGPARPPTPVAQSTGCPWGQKPSRVGGPGVPRAAGRVGAERTLTPHPGSSRSFTLTTSQGMRRPSGERRASWH